MNKHGFGVIEFAAWIIVTAFLLKLVVFAVAGASVLTARERKMNLKGYNLIHENIVSISGTAND